MVDVDIVGVGNSARMVVDKVVAGKVVAVGLVGMTVVVVGIGVVEAHPNRWSLLQSMQSQISTCTSCPNVLSSCSSGTRRCVQDIVIGHDECSHKNSKYPSTVCCLFVCCLMKRCCT